jgi:hypothetical protein
MAQWHAKDGTYKRYDAHGRLIQRVPVAMTPPLGTKVVIGEKMQADHDRLVAVSPRFKPRPAPHRGSVVVESDEATSEANATTRDTALEEKLKKYPWLAEKDDFVKEMHEAMNPMEISPRKLPWCCWSLRLRNKDLEALEKGEIKIVVPHDRLWPMLINPMRSDREAKIYEKARHFYPDRFDPPPRTRHKEIYLYLPGQEPKEVR